MCAVALTMQMHAKLDAEHMSKSCSSPFGRPVLRGSGSTDAIMHAEADKW